MQCAIGAVIKKKKEDAAGRNKKETNIKYA
jgi:hypothetical protein